MHASRSDALANYFWIVSLLRWLRCYGFFYAKSLCGIFSMLLFLVIDL
jgi:hypothetical protein